MKTYKELIKEARSKNDDTEFFNFIYSYLKNDKTLQKTEEIFLGSLAYNIEEKFRKMKGMSFSEYTSSTYPKKLKRNLQVAIDKVFGSGTFNKLVAQNKKR